MAYATIIGALLLSVSSAAAVTAGAQTPVAGPNPLDRARAATNARQYDAAIVAAREALRVPELAQPAAVVLARAHLERFRVEANPQDLVQARESLATVRPAALAPNDEVAFLMSQGLLLYLDGCAEGCYSAAAELFGLALARSPAAQVVGEARDAIFEWWAGALDRQAQFGLPADRPWIYRRVLVGAEQEVADRPDSAVAPYWVAVGARGFGDLERAWGAAVAAWVRSRAFGARAGTLRADLDRFVTEVLLPERARAAAQDGDPRPIYAQLLAQWDEIKKKYP